MNDEVPEFRNSEQALEWLVRKFVGAWNRRDLKTVASLFSSDHVFDKNDFAHTMNRPWLNSGHTGEAPALLIGDVTCAFQGRDAAVVRATWHSPGPLEGLLELRVFFERTRWAIDACRNSPLAAASGEPKPASPGGGKAPVTGISPAPPSGGSSPVEPGRVLQIRNEQLPEGVTLVTLRGGLDDRVLVDLESAFRDLFEAGAHRLIVDLSGVEYCDGLVLGLLIDSTGTAQGRGGDLILLKPRPHVLEVIQLLGLSEVLTWKATLEDAAAALDSDAE